MNIDRNTDKSQKKQRIVLFDIVRSLCMLWIVAFWHLLDTIKGIPRVPRGLEGVTIASLAAFVFISGYFMGQRKNEDVLTFYKLRLKRFYFLFAISCITLWIISYYGKFTFINTNQLILSLLGVCCLVPKPPFTLWFFSMIICFYAVTPIFNSSKISNRAKLCAFIGFFIIIFFCTYYFHIDNRLMLYYPVYMLGLFVRDLKKEYYWVLLYCAVSCLGIGLFVKFRNNYFVNMLIAFGSPFFILSIAYYILKKLSFLNSIFNKIGYASMCMYLYHRQFFFYTESLQKYLNPYLTWIVLVASLFVLSYTVQYLYDFTIRKIESKKTNH